MAGISTNVCLLFPALSALSEDYDAYAVFDSSGTWNDIAQQATMGKDRNRMMDKSDTSNQYRVLSPKQILSWIEDDAQIMRLRTDRDVIPGGYMAAAIPVLVD